jgi:hypothetical protein
MTKEELENTKKRMKEYRDIFGGELNRKDLIDDADSIFDLETILNMHYDYINDMASDAQSNLEKFKRDIGVF